MPSKIQWTDESWNPVIGCTKCSPGCLHCYAERMAIRLNGIFAAKGDDDNWAKMSNVLKWDYFKPELYEFGKATGWNGEVELFTNRLDIPFHWRKPRRIFVCSMSDLFHPKVPFEFICKVMRVVEKCSQHTFLMLTKRPQIAYDFFGGTSGAGLSAPPLPNLHLSVSISNQAEADEKIPILLQIPAAVRWLSIEPMLGSIQDACHGFSRPQIPFNRKMIDGWFWEELNWVVVGCESGPKRRFCKIEWVHNIVDQCKDSGVPCFVKQISIDGKVVKMPKKYPQEYPERK